MALRITKRHIELAGRWLPSAFIYGVSGGIALIYITDWKAVAQYVPYYGGRFKE